MTTKPFKPSTAAIALVLLAGGACAQNAPPPANPPAPASVAGQSPLTRHAIVLADPTIFVHDGTYYLYGTVGGNAGNGFTVYTSRDLERWVGPVGAGADGFALLRGETFGTRGFWAPQIFHRDGRFHMAYTADENLAIAVADSPLGPFRQQVHAPLPAPVKQIDPFVFIDDDGARYLYHVRLTEGNRIFVARMKDDFSGIDESTLREAISASLPWENTAAAAWPVSEGPSILQRNGLYYLVYSANDFRNPDYAVGYAVSEHPLGPWRKFDGNPILTRRDIGINGTGHGDFFRDNDGQLWYVFHTHQSNDTVSPRRTALIRARFDGDGHLEMEPATYRLLEAN